MPTEVSPETPLATLFERFENDIRYDAHSTRAKASRSQAGKEIRRRGESAISLAREQLATLKAAAKTPLDQEVVDGWELLIR